MTHDWNPATAGQNVRDLGKMAEIQQTANQNHLLPHFSNVIRFQSYLFDDV